MECGVVSSVQTILWALALVEYGRPHTVCCEMTHVPSNRKILSLFIVVGQMSESRATCAIIVCAVPAIIDGIATVCVTFDWRQHTPVVDCGSSHSLPTPILLFRHSISRLHNLRDRRNRLQHSTQTP
jgi:hypothetical protein